MTLSIDQWHQRYLQQARWTHNLREYLYQKYDLHRANKILEVGCGTGVLQQEIHHTMKVVSIGLDIDLRTLEYATGFASDTHFVGGDGHSLPFSSATFDITLCHFLLLWVGQPKTVVSEMKRVTRPGGYVLAMAEPDYGGRIDYPEELSQVGRWQTEALKKQGADPCIGRQIRSIFSIAGLQDIEAGVIGGQWVGGDLDQDVELEWKVLQSDLEDNQKYLLLAERLKKLEQDSRASGRRILFVPVFYAIGKVSR